MSPYVVAIVGSSGSGKTRLIERLVPPLRKRGLRVGTIKHAHDRIDLDSPGKDSWRHLKAGAEAVAIVGPKQLMWMKAIPSEDGLTQALKGLPAEVDLILLEGFHDVDLPQIFVADRVAKLRRGSNVLAIVSNRPTRSPMRRFKPNQIGELARFIEGEWMKQWEKSFWPTSQESSSAVG